MDRGYRTPPHEADRKDALAVYLTRAMTQSKSVGAHGRWANYATVLQSGDLKGKYVIVET